jgi:hypothetical protein
METVDQYLARGGRIQQVPIQPARLERQPQGEALRKRSERRLLMRRGNKKGSQLAPRSHICPDRESIKSSNPLLALVLARAILAVQGVSYD